MNSIALRLLGSTASTVDRAFVAAFQMRNRSARVREEAFSHAERLRALALIRDMYGAPELISDVNAYFPVPPAVRPRDVFVRTLEWGGECHELSWESAFQPFDQVSPDAYRATGPNGTAYARLYGGARPRPAVILIHGYMTGQWAFEERAWPIRWFHRHGLDVALAVLPFHGLRARPGGGAPPFPGGDPRLTNEGFRQVVSDLRSLANILKQRGAPSVGVMGMSLGGYSTALLATVESDLSFAIPLIPLASVADFARDQGRLGTGERARLQHAALEAANRVVSPLARPRRVPKERMLIVAADADRVTPMAHADRLAAHFGVRLLRVHGGHLVQTWRAEAFHAIREMLRSSGIIR
ncbi:MAG: alpha/beta hydrolase family protein [Polyangiaceae bacterium]